MLTSETLVICDVSNLAHRAKHSHKGMFSPAGEPCGVFAGILQECRKLERLFDTNTLAFCFDSKHLLRKTLHPGYKGAREAKKQEESDEDKEARFAMYTQVKELNRLLPLMGCKNVFGVKGYEADDLISSLAASSQFGRAIIVSSDEDLYQCLGPSISQYKPVTQQLYTVDMLMEEYGLMPCQWPSAKAWAGDDGDSIPGIKGVGTKTAAKWILGKASEKQKALFEQNLALYNQNIQLVKLPFPGTPKLQAIPQEAPIDWSLLEEKIGISTAMPPGLRKTGV